MSRIPVRARLTGAFAVAMLIVLAAAALFVHASLEDNLNQTIDNALRSGATTAEPAEGFTQVIAADGRLLSARGGARSAALSPAELRRALRGPLTVERRVPGVEGETRMLARRAGPSRVAVAGQSLDDRDETLAGLTRSFAIGGPAAVLLASLAGYLLAGLGLAPVEAMRRRAERLSLGGERERLPLPAAHDEIRRLGTTLNGMLDRMNASYERERRFVADASHELRTPLAVLKTELETALRTSDAGAQRESLGAALEEVDQLAQLADDLLLLAHAGEGRLKASPERIDVRELLERARERFADRARERGRSITVDAPAGLVAPLDPLRMRQALGNLVDNALRHGDGQVRLSAAAHGGRLAIEVADSGPGIPAELAGDAFERFTRGQTARSGGSGLGLAIVRAIADAHGGTAAAVEGGPGAAVRLTLPLS